MLGGVVSPEPFVAPPIGVVRSNHWILGATPVVAGGIAEGALLVTDFLLRGINMIPTAISRTAATTNANNLRASGAVPRSFIVKTPLWSRY